MDKIKLIYVATDNVGHVLEGQVFKLLEYYQTLPEIFSEIVLLQPYSSEAVLEKLKAMLERYSFRKVYIKAKPIDPLMYFTNMRNMRDALKKEVTDNTVIHSRGSLMTSFIRRSLPSQYRDAYILTDCRGLGIDEWKTAHGHRLVDYVMVYCVKVPYARFLINRIYKDKYAHITTVSPYLKQVIIENGAPAERISVHPNIVSPDFIYNEQDRRTIREKYGIDFNQPVAVMSSGVGDSWQGDQILIDRLLELGFVIFNLGKNKVNKDGVINGFLPRSEMPKYLSAADVAVLWREDIPLNNVACPSKFGEFVTMGLYVIHNGTVDIVKRFIEDNAAGVIISKPEELTIDKTKLEIDIRLKRCKAGFEVFSVERIAESYIRHYIDKN